MKEEPVQINSEKDILSGTIAHCKHENCGAVEKVWLPFEFEERQRGLKPHPFCIHCGVVKNMSADRAKPMGFYTNILARMQITKVQIRLIIKELESIDFDDVYSMTGSEQKRVFNRVVKKYYNVSEQ